MPEPVMVSIAAAVAGKSVGALYELVKAKLGRKADAAAVLVAADGKDPGSTEVTALATELETAERADPDFAERLRDQWAVDAARLHADQGGVVNQITGNVSGKVLQARDIHGGVSF
ncbi:hypothetical protein [Actinokineospora inagensis]|uniref:hypothetical protein n=1 Tax=Actinokineospora inagensis TaxID=103730 RepID=UPI00047A0BC7|nr:hypothetical protein [Actinokineospora inagensis]